MDKKAPFRIEWDAHEYEHKERSSDWFWAVGILSVSIAVAAVIFGNVIFGVFILSAVFALALFINREPDNVHIIVDEKGIAKDRIRYPYSTLQSFWIDTDHSHPKILLSSEKIFMPLIIIPLGNGVDAENLHQKLILNLQEKYHSLPFVEKFIESLGF
jgi:hypothetical protein